MPLSRATPLFSKLASSELCRGLEVDEVAVLFELAVERKVGSGELIFREGDSAVDLLVIGMGRVEISRKGEWLASLGTGDTLGELSLLSRAHTRSASAKALSEVKLLSISSVRFRRLLEGSNVAALKVVSNLAHQLAERLLELNDKFIKVRAEGRVDPRPSLGRFVY